MLVGIASFSDWVQAQSVPNQAEDGSHAAAEKPFELLLRGGRIIDGTGAPWYIADLGIAKGKIAAIGRIAPELAARVIDVDGMVVAPGFIDMMGQSASPMMLDPKTAINLLTQGITTINAGEGVSAAPLASAEGSRQGWTTMAEYMALLDMQGLPLNVAQSVGHTQVRRIVLGSADRRPDLNEMDRMKALVREGMQAGAIGLSTALIYPPATYATTEEVAGLASVAGECGGRYFTHMRNEGDRLLEAIDEALEIGRLGKLPVHIFHLKTAGEQNWGKMPMAIAKIREARSRGQSVAADVYPYVHNGLEISAFIHPRHFASGREAFLRKWKESDYRNEVRKEIETSEGWENWFRNVNRDWSRVIVGQTSAKELKELVGQSIDAIAKNRTEDPWETFGILVREGAFVLPQSMSEANKILAIQQDFVSFCTDVGPDNGNLSASHPRAYGSFPKIFARYVRELGALSMEQAIAHATATAANEIFAFDRGRIAQGLVADLIVFHPQRFADAATFTQPKLTSQGMQYVLVNGQVVFEDGKLTSARSGRVLRGPGYDRNLRPAAVMSGEPVRAFDRFEKTVQAFIDTHAIVGASIAVTKDSQIVYSRGFGYSDIGQGTRVQPDSLFRIASISKPITAVAIMQLIERGKLKLEDMVVSILKDDEEIERAGAEFDPRWRQVTIEHLLQHRGGWDRDKSFDAMFQSVRFAEQRGVPSPAGPWDVIRAMYRQKFDFDPGERYAYSNFGYCLLGRVIEKVSGKSYEEFVKENVLDPIGNHAMRVGATREERRAPNEVRYYYPGQGSSVFQSDLGQPVPVPYGAWHLEAMDAHGGWIASANDLARFAMALDEKQNVLLSQESKQRMHQRPDGKAGYDELGVPLPTYYSLGWLNRSLKNGTTNHWHTGSLAGTSTILIRLPNGCNLVALFNSRTSPSVEHLGRAADTMLGQAIRLVDFGQNH
jgi:N-acyl-D-amino-acid deacylase